jgi:zinc protease
MHRLCKLHTTHWRALMILALGACLAGGSVRAETQVGTFKLANGMQVVVIPDHRVPVVTHMVWYRVGAADDPWGTSGIAHFLEHLMFKSTGKIKSGEFSRIITSLGGRDNAATTHDTTAYFQRVAKEHLRRVMELEADRMVNLRLLPEEVRTERDVILEERRSSVDGNPLGLLSEQMFAALYQNHPYHRPALGWEHEMSALTLKDASTFYKRYYAPNNAVLVVAGDVTPQEVQPLAEATYGRNKANPAISQRVRAQEPPAIAARRVQFEDARASAPILLRYYFTASYPTSHQGEAESLELLTWIIGGDDTSRMYRRLVDAKLSSTAGAKYDGSGLDSGHLDVVVVPYSGVSIDKAESELNAIIADVRDKGVTPEELDRAKAAFEARRVFETDNQTTLANRYGQAIAVGRSVADIDAVPMRIQARTLDDIKRAANEFLNPVRSVTGTLTQPPAATTALLPAAAKQ